MCFLIQAALFAGASATAWLLTGVLGAPLWVGGVGGCASMFIAWIGYIFYQAAHPDWWPPWDDGLPQPTRMMNAFVPAGICFVLAMILFPVFKDAREKAHISRLKQGARQLMNTGKMPPTKESIGSIIEQATKLQVKQAREKYATVLNYEPDSFRRVDRILGKLHEQYLLTPNDTRWKTEPLGWAAYVGEVIRRKYGGEWERMDEKTGQALPLKWKASTSFPVAWCSKRIVNGDEDSIWVKVQVLSDSENIKQLRSQK